MNFRLKRQVEIKEVLGRSFLTREEDVREGQAALGETYSMLGQEAPREWRQWGRAWCYELNWVPKKTNVEVLTPSVSKCDLFLEIESYRFISQNEVVLDSPGCPVVWESIYQFRVHRFDPLVQEDSACQGAIEPVCHNYWSLYTLESVLHKSHCSEKPVHLN